MFKVTKWKNLSRFHFDQSDRILLIWNFVQLLDEFTEGTNDVIKNLGQMYSFPRAKNEKIPNDSLLPK